MNYTQACSLAAAQSLQQDAPRYVSDGLSPMAEEFAVTDAPTPYTVRTYARGVWVH